MVIKKLRNTGYFGTYYKIYLEEVMPVDKINELLLPDKIEFERIFFSSTRIWLQNGYYRQKTKLMVK